MMMKKRMFASLDGSVGLRTQCDGVYASMRRGPIRLINTFRRTLPEIKLKRTDTTLDLSQKAKLRGQRAKGLEDCLEEGLVRQ